MYRADLHIQKSSLSDRKYITSPARWLEAGWYMFFVLRAIRLIGNSLFMDRRMKSSRVVMLYGLMAMLLTPAMGWAYVGLCCGKCGGNMPMNIPGGGIPETYEFRFKASPTFMHMEGLRDGTEDLNTADLLGSPVVMGQPTGRYMAVPTEMNMGMLNLAAGYSFSDRWFGSVMFMYRYNHMDMTFNSAVQSMTGLEGFTMKTQGVADTMLMGKYRLYADDPLIPRSQVSLLLGLSLPTGSIDERNDDHPVAMRRGELAPYGMQLGSGTVDPTIGLLYQASGSPYWWGVNTTYSARLYDNDRDYRLGNEATLDAYGMYQFRYDTLVHAQLNLKYKGRIRGEMDEAQSGDSGHITQGDSATPYMTPLWDPDNYGGNTAFATFGLQWQPAPMNILDISVGIPLYQDLNGPQLKQDYRLMLTWYLELPTSKSIRYKMYNRDAPNRLGF